MAKPYGCELRHRDDACYDERLSVGISVCHCARGECYTIWLKHAAVHRSFVGIRRSQDVTKLRDELEVPREDRRLGSGWISGVVALVLAVIGIGAVLCLKYPDLLTVPDARRFYDVALIRLALHVVLIAGFMLGIVSIVLRKQKALGFTALSLILVATILGGSRAESRGLPSSDLYFGLDWFLLNLTFTGLIFIPIERILGIKDQAIFRYEWREDVLYFLVSSLLVQGLTFLSLAPATAILKNTDWAGLRAWVGRQPVILQFIEIMFLTDLAQYWLHRAFHRLPFLWKFHAVHHSAQSMDWIAGARMHVMEIVCLRGFTVIPMYVLGFSEPAMYAYIFFVYLFSTFVHSNLRYNFGKLRHWLVTPQFHHWHHGIEKEAIDVNFAVHFPILDRMFGTHFWPEDDRWPNGYGIQNHPVPKGYLRQFFYPFTRKRKENQQ
jgi:sterol desaturase/sphingolipid hydroxylase (fatty acid hydroxylase superfamily)